MRANAAAGGDPVIVQIGDELGAAKRGLYDATDWTTLWQDTAGTTAVTAAGQTVKRIDDLSGNGFHLFAQGATNAISRDGYVDWNNADFAMQSPGLLTTGLNKTLLFVMDPQADTSFVFLGSDSSSGIYAGSASSGSSGSAQGAAQTAVKYSINNAADLSSPNAGALYTAIAAPSGWRSVALKDVSCDTVSALFFGYQIKAEAQQYSGRVKYIVLAVSPTPTQLSNIHTIWTTA